MRFRSLRIAWSIAWGSLAILLVVLWSRSQNWLDFVSGPAPGNRTVAVGTMPGTIAFAEIDSSWNPHVFNRWEWRSETMEVLQDLRRDSQASGASVDHFTSEDFHKVWSIGQGNIKTIPILWTIALSIALAPISLIPWSSRFTLRTLLVATTLVAAMLRLIVYETSK